MKQILIGVREFFWPLLEEDGTKKSVLENVGDVNFSTDNIDTAYDLTKDYFEKEDDRKKSVENKSTILLSAVGFTIAIIVAIAKDLVLNFPEVRYSFFEILLIINLLIIIIYLCRVAWFAIKSLERRSYHQLGPDDILLDNNNYKKVLIKKIIDITNKNSVLLNSKLDFMVMAQEYYKRVIGSIVVFSILLIIKLSYISTFYSHVNKNFNEIENQRKINDSLMHNSSSLNEKIDFLIKERDSINSLFNKTQKLKKDTSKSNK